MYNLYSFNMLVPEVMNDVYISRWGAPLESYHYLWLGVVPKRNVFKRKESSTTLKKLLDHTFSAFRIAISGTSTVSACRFLETIQLICEFTRKYLECFS